MTQGRRPGARPRVLQQHRHADLARGPRSDHGGDRGRRPCWPACHPAGPPSAALAGEWSVQEVVDHLVETYRPGLDELRCVLAGQRPPGEPIPAALQSKAPSLRPWSWLLDELRRAHRDVVEALVAAPAAFETDARVPIVMVVNVAGPTAGCSRCTGSRISTGRRTRWCRGGCTPSTT